jgi:integrase
LNSNPTKLTTHATINRELAVLSHLLNCAVEWGWIASVPTRVRRFQEKRTRIEYLTEAEIGRLLAASAADSHPQIYSFVFIALHTAMRASEVSGLRQEFIDLDKRVIHLSRSKTGARDVPISANLRQFLAEYVKTAVAEGGWLFPSPRSASGHTEDLAKPWRRIIGAAGLGGRGITRHTLRHTAISHLVNAGVDIPTVQKISGHKTIEMVCRYSHQNQQHVQAALSKLDSRIVVTAPSPITAATAERNYTRTTQTKTSSRTKPLQVLEKVGGPGWTRTSDQRIMSPLL